MRYFDISLYARFDRVALEILSLLCTFKNSTKCSNVSFDSDSFQNRPFSYSTKESGSSDIFI